MIRLASAPDVSLSFGISLLISNNLQGNGPVQWLLCLRSIVNSPRPLSFSTCSASKSLSHLEPSRMSPTTASCFPMSCDMPKFVPILSSVGPQITVGESKDCNVWRVVSLPLRLSPSHMKTFSWDTSLDRQ